MRRVIVVGVVVVGLVVGCGGGGKASPAVAGPGPAVGDAGDVQTPFAQVDAAPANVAPGPLSDAGAADESAAAAGSPAAAPASSPAEDKCAPVALAYEKSLRAKLRQCWLDAANKTKDRIIGSVKLVLEIDNAGKIAGQRFAEKSDLPEPIQKCIRKAFKAEPIDGKSCEMKTFTVSEKFPR